MSAGPTGRATDRSGIDKAINRRSLCCWMRYSGFFKGQQWRNRHVSHDVFISHSAVDKAVARAACAVLESHGIRCWIAPRDVRPGMDWAESIIDAINDTKVMV